MRRFYVPILVVSGQVFYETGCHYNILYGVVFPLLCHVAVECFSFFTFLHSPLLNDKCFIDSTIFTCLVSVSNSELRVDMLPTR